MSTTDDDCEHPRVLHRALREHNEMRDAMADMQAKELNLETPLGKLNAKGYHLGNLLQFAIFAAGTAAVVLFWDIREEAKNWNTIATASKAEHGTLIDLQQKTTKVMDANTAAIRFQTCVNAVPQDQRINQLKRHSACWWMSQGYAYEELGPERPR